MVADDDLPDRAAEAAVTADLDPEDELARRQRELDFVAWVRRQRCVLAGVRGAGECSGPGVDPDHMGTVAHHDRGTSQLPSDLTCVPMCRRHHEDRHANTGYFAGMLKRDRLLWQLRAIARTQLAYVRWRSSTPLVPF